MAGEGFSPSGLLVNRNESEWIEEASKNRSIENLYIDLTLYARLTFAPRISTNRKYEVATRCNKHEVSIASRAGP